MDPGRLVAICGDRVVQPPVNLLPQAREVGGGAPRGESLVDLVAQGPDLVSELVSQRLKPDLDVARVTGNTSDPSLDTSTASWEGTGSVNRRASAGTAESRVRMHLACRARVSGGLASCSRPLRRHASGTCCTGHPRSSGRRTGRAGRPGCPGCAGGPWLTGGPRPAASPGHPGRPGCAGRSCSWCACCSQCAAHAHLASCTKSSDCHRSAGLPVHAGCP